MEVKATIAVTVYFDLNDEEVFEDCETMDEVKENIETIIGDFIVDTLYNECEVQTCDYPNVCVKYDKGEAKELLDEYTKEEENLDNDHLL